MAMYRMDIINDPQSVERYAGSRGFYTDFVDADDEVFMSKRLRHGTRYLQISPDGLVNGEADYKAEIDRLLSV